MILDGVLLRAAVRHALLAVVGPAEGGLDAVAGVVGKGQADGAGGRDRQQVRVADAVLPDLLAQVRRQTRGESATRQVEIGIERREGPALAREFHRRRVGRVAHQLGDAPGLRARFGRAVGKAQHHEGIAQAGEAQTHPALVDCLPLLLRQRPHRRVEHVVQHAHRDAGHLREPLVVEARRRLERIYGE